jgi:hypothetical protein
MRFAVKRLGAAWVVWDTLVGAVAPYGWYTTKWEAEVVAWLRNRQQA